MTPAGDKRLRILLVEDSEDDAELLIRTLRRAGYRPDVRRVQTAEEMTAALREQAPWDVVISDHSLPEFSAPAAFALMQQSGLDLPFIMVSGTVGEEIAVEAMRTGVHDYILKGNLRRLVPAIEREMREAAGRAERRKIQEQLMISERMASVGTLAAGVAHEINNPLSVVIGNLDFLAADLTTLAELVAASHAQTRGTVSEPLQRLTTLAAGMREPVTDAQEAAERVRVIVRDLRLFSRADEEARGPVDVRKVLDSSLRMARNEIRHRAQVVRDYGDVPAVLGNQARLGQVFLNLLINAAQAIPEGRIERNTITIAARKVERRVVVEISDTGEGIPPEVLPRIFDVFFTTKAIGVGTGLGLAICHRIVTALEGEIAVESRLGEGTTFRVALPVARTGLTREMPVMRPAAPAPRRRASLLIVEDEATVGRTLQRLLAPHHDATVVTSGREGLARLQAGQTFDAILCDLMMPEMTGMDFHAAVAPEVAQRIIFMTGGAFTPGARAFLERVPNPRLDKPIDLARLKQLVDELV